MTQPSFPAAWSRLIWYSPLVLALIGLAVPMIGSGFIGWPFVVGWLMVIAVIWWVRPLVGADRTTRLGAGALTLGCLALLSTLGGFYLIPSVVVWIVLVATNPPRDLGTRSSPALVPSVTEPSEHEALAICAVAWMPHPHCR